jgi:hypothetical protein
VRAIKFIHRIHIVWYSNIIISPQFHVLYGSLRSSLCPTLVAATESNGIGAVERGFKISESIGRFAGGALSDCDYKLGSDT